MTKLGLTTLSKRRERGDHVEYFKIVNGLTQVNWHNPNKLCDSLSCSGPAGSIRGYQHRMSKQLTRINQREHFILNRVVDNWNRLPPEVVKASLKNLFKKMVDEINTSRNLELLHNKKKRYYHINKPMLRRRKQSMNLKKRKEKCPLGKLFKHLTTPMMHRKMYRKGRIFCAIFQKIKKDRPKYLIFTEKLHKKSKNMKIFFFFFIYISSEKKL
ncbi:RNA-directed DNA polymerase from mobile element jockey-like [Brachionus plicatilis]|uniref:RNA-directed DNA polymerase from mobile element jockey-like n=1 Tax=Brachionus plicatilis TaxID=10195 RepID=A0A3M7RNH3_BRAPC|nr:RNA-directed DNA polymerase from mobile element jockey-like [Brachionus plicatilis]